MVIGIVVRGEKRLGCIGEVRRVDGQEGGADWRRS